MVQATGQDTEENWKFSSRGSRRLAQSRDPRKRRHREAMGLLGEGREDSSRRCRLVLRFIALNMLVRLDLCSLKAESLRFGGFVEGVGGGIGEGDVRDCVQGNAGDGDGGGGEEAEGGEHHGEGVQGPDRGDRVDGASESGGVKGMSSLLHGNRGSGRTPLNWENRSAIALAAAKGIEYIHSTSSSASHGNIKSSNILLDRSYEAKVSDHSLCTLAGPSSTPNCIAAAEMRMLLLLRRRWWRCGLVLEAEEAVEVGESGRGVGAGRGRVAGRGKGGPGWGGGRDGGAKRYEMKLKWLQLLILSRIGIAARVGVCWFDFILHCSQQQ